MKIIKATQFLALIGVLLTAAFLLPVIPARADSTIHVNSSADNTTPGDGFCTLREAITNANDNAATFSDCLAGSGADTIDFTGNSTITLGSALPALDGALTITGNGAANTIVEASACNPVTPPVGCTLATYSIFNLIGGASLTLNGLTLRHGNGAYYGGAISPPNPGSMTVTINNSALTANRAVYSGGAITIFGGTLTITDSTLSGNYGPADGGAIFATNVSTVNITRSTLSGNHTDQDGGAVRIYSTVTAQIKDSTISGNSTGASGKGGGVASEGSMTIANSTISGNSANTGGGVWTAFTPLTLLNSTIVENSATNGGGVYLNAGGTLNAKNSIVANSPGFNDCATYGTIGTNVNNLDETGWCFPGLTGDPGLGPLDDYGGPTLTHAPLAGSPVIGAGDETTCTSAPISGLDQRGLARTAASCEIGAVEYVPCYSLTLSHSGSGADPAASPARSSGCTAGKYIEGEAIGLTAAPASYWHMGSWSGTDDNTLTALTNTLTMPAAAHTTSVVYQPDLLTLTLYSEGKYDGWILESSEGTTRGGTLSARATTFRLGDDAMDRQYRAVLSFNTNLIPAGATLTSATLKIRKQGLVGTNPFSTHSGLKIDMRIPYFGSGTGLALGDFNALAGKSAAATFGAKPLSGWYSAVLSSTARDYLNRSGRTQFRLRFAKGDNDDRSADYLSFYSGNAGASARPVLVIQYTMP